MSWMRRVAVAGVALVAALVAPGCTPTPAGPNDYPGGDHRCAVAAGGTVKCSGLNTWGQLGNGTRVDRNVPVTVVGASGATEVEVGFDHSCALVSGGEVRCWGSAEGNGRDGPALGDGSGDDSSVAVGVVGISGATAIAVGGSTSCALEAGGTVACWGTNYYGDVGDGTYQERFTPVPVTGIADATGIAAGGGTTCAVRTGGTVSCWGIVLGAGPGTSSTFTPLAVTGLSGVVALSVGDSHACAVRADGTVACWGANDRGQLGTGSTAPSATPVDVPGVSGATGIAAGRQHTCAALSDGSAACWGRNRYGQLGNGTTTDSLVPVGVEGGLDEVVAIEANGATSCATVAGGAQRCWGYNRYGALGDGGNTDRHLPVAVLGIP